MRASRMRLLVALILLLPIAGLTSLAYASPPDPSWIRGIYDDADYDDVVLLITSATGTAAPSARAGFGRTPLVVSVPLRAQSHVLARTVSPLQSRAPPASLLPLL